MQASPFGRAEEEELVKGPSAEKASTGGRKHKSGCVSVCACVCVCVCVSVSVFVWAWKPCRLSGGVLTGAGTGLWLFEILLHSLPGMNTLGDGKSSLKMTRIDICVWACVQGWG